MRPEAGDPRAARASPSWWARLNLWRALAFAGFALAIALGWTMVAPRAERPDERIVVVLGPSEAKPALVGSVDRGARHLTVRVLEQVAPLPGYALELWMVPDDGPPRSLGLVPATGIAKIALGAPAGILFQRIPRLALSLEPAAGAPHEKPSGALLYSGPVHLLY